MTDPLFFEFAELLVALLKIGLGMAGLTVAVAVLIAVFRKHETD